MGTNTFAYAIANTCTNTISDADTYCGTHSGTHSIPNIHADSITHASAHTSAYASAQSQCPSQKCKKLWEHQKTRELKKPREHQKNEKTFAQQMSGQEMQNKSYSTNKRMHTKQLFQAARLSPAPWNR